jgi:hypothetical protein
MELKFEYRCSECGEVATDLNEPESAMYCEEHPTAMVDSCPVRATLKPVKEEIRDRS